MQADFAYQAAQDSAGCQLAVTIIADRELIRAQLHDDAEAAGFRVIECCTLEDYAQAGIASLGDLLLIDCAQVDAQDMAQLSRLDIRAGKAGAQMVVATSMAALDAVFGCFALSGPQILVDPGRAERVIAIGRALAHVPNLRLRELDEEDRLMLLRLTEQVGQIAMRLERTSPGKSASGGAFRLESPAPAWRGQGEEYLVEAKVRARLPEPALLRRILKARQARARFFDGDLFADPAWDMLLDLAAARGEGLRVSVTSLCIAAGVPATTALRWIGQMVEAGLLLRVQDPEDRRRAFIALADTSAAALANYFAEVGTAELAAV
ncbi:winged helix DNA-binding protein [Qipengyuania marisflavi]|uniref:Winged helix DNA-binding protein n=1 Tax=Qipengyuania marisflavi TaxID=2486356 RepID=A0A5S3P8S6_9SPHN|nr:winged helix DNA-binding protein [Qipengyuania marisflavi]TMM48844.1 winged helix DNA-binding protein [Qipengyuania marisflavi]